MIDGLCKKIIEAIKDKIYSTGSEPAEGGWDTIENQNKLIYDKLQGLNPFVEYNCKVEYHTAYEYYPYPSRGWNQPYGWGVPPLGTWIYPVNIVNFYDKPYVILKDYLKAYGGYTPVYLWSPLGGEIWNIDFTNSDYQFIGTYFDTVFKVVFFNFYGKVSKTIERHYSLYGSLINEVSFDGNTFNGMEVVRVPYNNFYRKNYILVNNLYVSFDNYFKADEPKTSITTGYIGNGSTGIFGTDTIERIVFLQNPALLGDAEILGNIYLSGEIWGFSKYGVLRFKC